MTTFYNISFAISALLLLSSCEKVDLTKNEEHHETQTDTGTTTTPLETPPTTDDNLTPPSTDTIFVDKDIPEECTLWNGHVVMMVEPADPGKYFVTLLARNEYDNVLSALADKEWVMTLTARYREDEIKGWGIPSDIEAGYLNSEYCVGSPRFERLNGLLKVHTPFNADDATRYLCCEGEKTFSMKSGTKISTAGAKTKYKLRPIKVMLFVIKDYKEPDDQPSPDQPSPDQPSTDQPSPDQPSPDQPSTDQPSSDNDSSTVTDNVPTTPCYLWTDGSGTKHAVVYTDSINGTITLLSRDNLRAKSGEAQAVAADYAEGNITDWDIPSEEFAIYLRDNYGITTTSDLSPIGPLNKILQETITPKSNSGNTYFLCDGGKKKFAFVTTIKPSAAATKTDYNLRLVKTIKK